MMALRSRQMYLASELVVGLVVALKLVVELELALELVVAAAMVVLVAELSFLQIQTRFLQASRKPDPNLVA